MSERKIYRPGTTARRKEWVSLPAGDICIWEMSVSDHTKALEQSELPSIDSRRGRSLTRGLAMQIMLSCYDGEEEGARRIFGDADFGAVYEMPFSEFDPIYAAMNRVNGKVASEQERLRDFSIATGAANNS